MKTTKPNKIFTLKIAILAFSSILLFYAFGCSPPGSFTINYLEPAPYPGATIATSGEARDLYYIGQKYDIRIALLNSGNVFGTSLEIKNKTNKTLLPNEYSIELRDGRDLLPLQVMSREVIAEYRAKLVTGQSIRTGNGVLDYSLNSLTGIIQTTTHLDMNQYAAYVGEVLSHYFSFRPIYPGFTRKGLLCFYHNFIIEYPINAHIKIRGEDFNFKFWLQNVEQVNPETNFEDFDF